MNIFRNLMGRVASPRRPGLLSAPSLPLLSLSLRERAGVRALKLNGAFTLPFFLFALLANVSASTVNFSFQDGAGNPIANTKVIIWPTAGPYLKQPWITGASTFGFTTDANGNGTEPNMQPGLFGVRLVQEPNTPFIISVPNDSLTYNVSSLALLGPQTGFNLAVTNVSTNFSSLVLSTNIVMISGIPTLTFTLFTSTNAGGSGTIGNVTVTNITGPVAGLSVVVSGTNVMLTQTNGAGNGTVYYQGLTGDGTLLGVNGSPNTSSGTFALFDLPQNVNTVYSGPKSGGPGPASFQPDPEFFGGNIFGLNAANITAGLLGYSLFPSGIVSNGYTLPFTVNNSLNVAGTSTASEFIGSGLGLLPNTIPPSSIGNQTPFSVGAWNAGGVFAPTTTLSIYLNPGGGANLMNWTNSTHWGYFLWTNAVNGAQIIIDATYGNMTNLLGTNTWAQFVGGGAGLVNLNSMNLVSPGAVRNFFLGPAGNITLTGTDNEAAGFHALFQDTTGSFNVATGEASLYANGTGSSNVATGYYALNGNSIGNANTAVGFQALYNLGSGSNNIGLGWDAGTSLASGEINNIDIGNNGVAGDIGQIRIGTAGLQTNFTWAGTGNGNGAGITSLNASQLASGTVPAGALGNAALLAGANFTGPITLPGTTNDSTTTNLLVGAPGYTNWQTIVNQGYMGFISNNVCISNLQSLVAGQMNWVDIFLRNTNASAVVYLSWAGNAPAILNGGTNGPVFGGGLTNAWPLYPSTGYYHAHGTIFGTNWATNAVWELSNPGS